jgi:nucleosome binding factor SPN SPT16 subunit
VFGFLGMSFLIHWWLSREKK